MVDKKAPTITIGTPNGGTYLLNQAMAANYTCTDAGSGVAMCSGLVSSGSNVDTASAGTKSFAVNASDNVGNAAAPRISTYTVVYNVCLLYDPSKSVHSASTIPLKIQICDA